MKKTALFLLALAAAACSSDEGVIEPSAPEVKSTPIELTATTSDDYTKSIFDGQGGGNGSFGKLEWSQTDVLGIYYEQSANAVDGKPAEKWAEFRWTGLSDNGDGSAHFHTDEMVWNTNPAITKHQFYGFYPVVAQRNALNKHESPYEKVFNLTNNQSLVVENGAAATQEEIAAAARTNYEKHQILISETAETSNVEKFPMTFKPILSYLCLHVYADQAEHAEFPADAKIYLSRLSVMGPEGTYLTGDFSINLKTQTILSEVLGSTRAINIALPGNGLELTRGGREASKPIYAVMLPVDLSGKQFAINGILTVVLSDNTVKKYQLTTKLKDGLKFEQGKGYDIYVKAQPGTDMTDLFNKTDDNDRGFIFRSNNKWYKFSDYANGKLTAEDFAAMGSDLYFIKADGSQVTSKDMARFELIGNLVNDIYDAKQVPVNVDMSSLEMDQSKAATSQFKPGIFEKKDATGAVVANPSWASVALPEGIRKINEDAFSNCINLKTVTLPNTLTYLGKHAFANCSALTDIVIPDHLNTSTDNGYNGFYEQVFDGCTALAYVNLPANIEVTEVPYGSFVDCTSLEKITIPNNISKVGAGCFKGCTALNEVTIRNRVAVIDIAGDDNHGEVFEGVAATGTLYVYKTMVEAYKAAIAAAAGTNKGWDLLKNWTVLPIAVTADSSTPTDEAL